MRALLWLAVVAAVAAPAALAAEPDSSGASAACKTLRTTAPALFGAGKTYRNLGACVSAKAAQAGQNAANAAKACRAEQADPAFATNHGGKTFADVYGTSANGNGHGQGNGNAFGKCVSAKASGRTAAQTSAQLNAARTCKAEQADTGFAGTHGGKSFAAFYGTNGNTRNAFGKCVSTHAKA